MLSGMDPAFTIGNAITIICVIFGAGGAWVAVKLGLSDLGRDFRENQAAVEKHFQGVHREMNALRDEFVRKDVDGERDKLISIQLSNLREELSRQSRRIEDLDKRK